MQYKLFIFPVCMICLSVGSGSLGHNVAAATRGPLSLHCSSKVEQVTLDP